MKKNLLKKIFSIIFRILLFILCVFIIIHEVKAVYNNKKMSFAKEKLNIAIKATIFSEELKLEDAIKAIDGFESLEIDKKTGKFTIIIDGQEILINNNENLNSTNGE